MSRLNRKSAFELNLLSSPQISIVINYFVFIELFLVMTGYFSSTLHLFFYWEKSYKGLDQMKSKVHFFRVRTFFLWLKRKGINA